MTLLLGLDVGSSGIKAVVYTPEGRTVALGAAPTPTHYPRPGWAYYRPDELWDQTVRALRAALAQLAPAQTASIAGLAVASVGEAGVPLDAHGQPTYDAIAWFDCRSRPQADRLAATVGRDRLFAVSGLSLQPIWSLFKLLWLRDEEPAAFARTARWLNVADYVAYRLCGVPATDHSLGSRTHALDLAALRWHDGLLREVGLLTDLFAPLVPSGTRLGPVTPEAAAETGLPTTAIVAAGGHDHVCGALAGGVVDPGQALNSLGTAEALFLPIARPIADPAFGAQGYTQGAHVVPGRYYAFGGQYTAGAVIDWLRALVGAGLDYDALLAEAEDTPPGSLGATFLPHIRIAPPPIDDPEARGAYVGLRVETGRGALVRATLEGLAYASRGSFDGLLAHTELPKPAEIVAIGGVARNRLLMRIKAALLDLPFVVAAVDEATSLGAAVLGGLAADIYTDPAHATRTLRADRTPVPPDPALVPPYNRLYHHVYVPLYPTLHPVHQSIQATQEDPTLAPPAPNPV